MDEPSDDLMADIYDRLRDLAVVMMTRERRGHTLQPTALVHEAWMRLASEPDARWNDRSHFLAVAARCMRRVLVDHARAHATSKRGGGWARVTLTGQLGQADPTLEVLVLDDALNKLASLDPRAARIAEMRLFADMTVAEIAAALEVSRRTVDGDWATARLWLSREMRPD
ncbi:MAG: sigma-70 family RNA polymerase sigma factor [Myxococcales bacterium]|nr:sigma-70 family RNA polymerase sigma factor [Myxococcales bacterium]